MTTERIAPVAHRHGFSEEAARAIWQSLQSTGGGLAQFDHPELGGRGQWMPGMTMIGAMSDTALKARVGALCADLAALVTGRGNPSAIQQEQTRSPEGSPGLERDRNLEPMGAMGPSGGTTPWWSEDLGRPTSTGGQNDMRYAYFAGNRRLIVSRGSEVIVYDTADHEISGVSQQQGGGETGVVFTSQHGEVPLAKLKVIGP